MAGKSISYPHRQWIADRYGSYRGFLYTWWYRLLDLLGRYRGYRRIEWTSVERLVFICKGNICRSAYAEAIARREGLMALSCGMDTRKGAHADKDAMRAARLRGVELQHHRTTPIQSVTLNKEDLLVVMEPSQAEAVMQMVSHGNQCTLLGIWGRGREPYIRDPYGTSAIYFDNCFERIEESVHGICEKVRAAKRG